MTDKPADMVELSLDIGGSLLPSNYPFVLWDSLLTLTPALSADPRIGILPLRLADESIGLLPKRAKLVLRVPTSLSDQLAATLAGQTLELADSTLQLGATRIRKLTPYPTLHAQQVACDEEEIVFMDSVRARLDELNIACNLICGMRRRIGDETRAISGYSLVIHDLKLDASLKLQYAGLGEGRQFGCGVFVPYKVITGLDDD